VGRDKVFHKYHGSWRFANSSGNGFTVSMGVSPYIPLSWFNFCISDIAPNAKLEGVSDEEDETLF
jgi:hypothetical protein